MGFIDFALAECNFINIMKTNLLLWGVHDMVSPNPNSKFESFRDFWQIRNKWIPTLIWFDHKKTLLNKLCEIYKIGIWWNYGMKIFSVLICPIPMSYVFEALDLVEYMDHMEQQLPGFQRESKLILVEDCILSILVC